MKAADCADKSVQTKQGVCMYGHTFDKNISEQITTERKELEFVRDTVENLRGNQQHKTL